MAITIETGVTIDKGLIFGDVPVIYPKTPHTIAATGNAQISTAQVKFGTGSYTSNSLNGYISATPYTDFAFGTKDFTVECWYYPTSTVGDVTVMGTRPAGINGAYVTLTVSNGGILGYYSGGIFRIQSATGAVVTNTWNSIAVSRVSGNTRLFLNGTQVGVTFVDATNYLSGSCIFGANDYAQNGLYPVKGYLDEMRISNIGRYAGNYTPATSAFVTDNNTLLLIHSDGTNGSTAFVDASNSV